MSGFGDLKVGTNFVIVASNGDQLEGRVTSIFLNNAGEPTDITMETPAGCTVNIDLTKVSRLPAPQFTLEAPVTVQ